MELNQKNKRFATTELIRLKFRVAEDGKIQALFVPEKLDTMKVLLHKGFFWYKLKLLLALSVKSQ